MIRFFIAQAHDRTWCRVEEARRKEWNEWMELDDTDEKAWFIPSYAEPIPDMTPSGITFENPIFVTP
jgi:hypothetical protein